MSWSLSGRRGGRSFEAAGTAAGLRAWQCDRTEWSGDRRLGTGTWYSGRPKTGGGSGGRYTWLRTVKLMIRGSLLRRGSRGFSGTAGGLSLQVGSPAGDPQNSPDQEIIGVWTNEGFYEGRERFEKFGRVKGSFLSDSWGKRCFG